MIYIPLPAALSSQYPEVFRPSPFLEARVEFWRNVYANYDLHHTILHDNQNPKLIYGVLNFETIENNVALSEREKRALRSGIEGEKKAKLKEMLLRFAEGEKPQTAGERLIHKLFDKISDHDKFKEAAERIRGQWGQKSKFEEGLVRSGRYMPWIEKIFVLSGVPEEITRLVFVESMFQLEATSKVGAGGPWQFMRQTARLQKLVMNEFLDERRDPLIAAAAAAKLLLKNYNLLQSWPLAINAYNTGPVRMLKAERALGTKRIDTIIENYSDRGYQFASRNFYPEFLAAWEVSQNHRKYFGLLELEKPIAFDEVTLSSEASLDKLAEIAATDVGVLKDLNPAYHDRAFQKGVALPKGYTIRVPAKQAPLFLAALKEEAQSQKYARWHVVKRGETLHKIAGLYGITVAELKIQNRMKGIRLLPNQILKIPGPPEALVLEDRTTDNGQRTTD